MDAEVEVPSPISLEVQMIGGVGEQHSDVRAARIGGLDAGAHAGVEWVDMESVVKLAEILAEAAVNYCAAPELS